MKAMEKEVSPADWEKIRGAIVLEAFGSIGNPNLEAHEMMKDLNGMTAIDLMIRADSSNERGRQDARNYKDEEIRRIARDIAELEALRESSKKTLEEMKQITIEKVDFIRGENGLYGDRKIEVVVKNNTPHALSSVKFKGVLRSPGRSVAWAEDEFYHSIPGGLEPGESARWTLYTGAQWAVLPKDRNDYELSLDVVGADGADGKSLFPEIFGERHEESIVRYRAVIEELKAD